MRLGVNKETLRLQHISGTLNCQQFYFCTQIYTKARRERESKHEFTSLFVICACAARGEDKYIRESVCVGLLALTWCGKSTSTTLICTANL